MIKILLTILALMTIFSCGSSKSQKKTIDKSVQRPINSAKSKGMIILYQDGSNDILKYKLIKDKKNAILTLETQFGFNAAKLYMKGDSVWVIIPSEKVVYFQDKSNILLIPTIKTDDVPVGMLMDYLIGNFSFKYSIITDESDLDLIQALKEIRYGYLDGDLAKVEYEFGKTVMNTSISHIGNRIKLNLKRNENLVMTINIENIVLQADMDKSIFIPKIPKNYQFVTL